MLSFASAPGNVYNRTGKLGLVVKQVQTYQAAQLTNLTDTTNGVVAQYNGESDLQAQVGSTYIATLAGPENACSVVRGLARTTVNRMVFRDNPQISQTLTQLNVLTSLNEIIRQMEIAGASVLQTTTSITPANFAAPTSVGNAVVTGSINRPGDGRMLENAFAEHLLLTCTADSYSGSANAGNEPIQVTGTGAQTDVFAFNWPLGSNCQVGLTVINGNTDNGQGNLLTNSGFETFTSTDTPDNWIIQTGTAGVQVFEETGTTYDGTNCLRLTGDGTALVTLYQEFDSATGTSGTLSDLTQYSVCIFLKRDAVAAGAGSLVVELVDDGGVQLQDPLGVACAFTINLTTLTTAWQSFTGVFRTPLIMPSVVRIRLRQATALTNGRSVYLDLLSMGLMTQTYTSGPYLAAHAGSIPLAAGDYVSCVVTNARGALGTLNTFQTLFAQLFTEMLSQGLLLPSSLTPTISDNLIG